MLLRYLYIFILIAIVIREISSIRGSIFKIKLGSRYKKELLKSNNNESPQILLKNGARIIGGTNTTSLNTKYYYFRGIPFAQPPIGELRFKPPVPLIQNSSQKVINATTDAPICVQFDIMGFDVIGSEDCLYLNVYTPQFPQQNQSLLSVMVWIYGGGFLLGDSQYKRFAPDYFMDNKNVIIVTFNYRVGVFGFLSTGDDASPGNYGLKDQILALKWVQMNIKLFGGNPKQVTIFGESAGSASVSYLSQTPLTKGLFSKAILQSGTSLCLWALTKDAPIVAKTIGTLLFISGASSGDLVRKLRNVNYKDLLIASSATWVGGLVINNPLSGLAFGPTVEPLHPGAVVINNSYENLDRGMFHNIPYLLGFNSMEGLPFYIVVNWLRIFLLKYDLDPTLLVPPSMNISNIITRIIVNNKIKQYYFGYKSIITSKRPLIEFISDNEFVRPIIKTSQLLPRRATTYFYRFSYLGSVGSSNRTIGVGHAGELPYLWKQFGGSYVTDLDRLTSRRMIKLWTNFAITGNPTPDSDSLLQNVKWPVANATSNSLTFLDIGNNLTVGTNPNYQHFMFWESLFNKYGNPPYSTY